MRTTVWRPVALMACLAMLAGCSSVHLLPTDHRGPDAGRIVAGIGANPKFDWASYSLRYRRVDPNRAPGTKSDIQLLTFWSPSLFRPEKPDYQAAGELGAIIVHSVPAGDYEVYDVDFYGNGGQYVQAHLGTPVPLSIRFTVRPGEAVYLGNYRAEPNETTDASGRTRRAWGGYFVVSDRFERDMALARRQADSPAGNDRAIDVTPDVAGLRNPTFVPARH